MGLDSAGRRLVVGDRLWLLQMAWPSGQASSMSAAATSVLELAASVLSGLSAVGRPATATTSTTKGPAAATTAYWAVLVLH
jgi:hypothetical protein